MIPDRFGRKDLVVGCLLFILILAIGQDYLFPSSWTTSARVKSGRVIGAEHQSGRRHLDVDIVISYYNEPLDSLEETITTVRREIGKVSSRVIIYYKGEGKVSELSKLASEVVPLKNIGREGATYLSHIVRHYDNGEQDFADHTIFLQPHLAWDWVIKPRLSQITPHTGFLSLGPYINMTKGVDVHGNDLPRINDIFAVFRQSFSPPHSVLATWAGQFVVSKDRILANSYKSYRNLLDMFEADKDHWIWKEGWWNNEPSNPTLGHALERSWPIIFDCYDASMAETCGEGAGPTCQCSD